VPQPSPTRQLLSREERQASILQAAARAFGRTGFVATSMDDVATEAGITRLIVYRHFGSKEELYRAVLEQVRARLAERIDVALAHPEPGAFPFSALIDVAREYPDAFRLLLVHAAREPQFAAYFEESRANGIQLADTIIRDMVGDELTDPVMTAFATQAMVGYIFETMRVWLDLGDPTRDDDFVARATEGAVAVFVVLAGLDRRPPAS
jgi:AcrR family transcriptional regulator